MVRTSFRFHCLLQYELQSLFYKRQYQHSTLLWTFVTWVWVFVGLKKVKVQYKNKQIKMTTLKIQSIDHEGGSDRTIKWFRMDFWVGTKHMCTTVDESTSWRINNVGNGHESRKFLKHTREPYPINLFTYLTTPYWNILFRIHRVFSSRLHLVCFFSVVSKKHTHTHTCFDNII